MALKAKPSADEMFLYEVLRHPLFCPEFIYNIDRVPNLDEDFNFTAYQKEMICDFHDHVSICTARATGKTVSLSSIIIWMLIFRVFPDDYILYAVPSKVHLEPVFTNLVRQFRSNSFLKNFIDRGAGINSSDYKITLLNQASLLCRIAGQSGTGANLIGLHTPIILADECIAGNQYIRGSNNVTLARDVSVGDEVLSWDGNIVESDRVSAIEKRRVDQKVLDIKHTSGSIHVGENHRVYTDNGYVDAGSLNVGDRIYILNNFSRSPIPQDTIDYIYDSILEGKTVDYISKNTGRTENSIRHVIDRELGGIRNVKDVDLSSEQMQVIIGTLLGDSSCDNRSVKRACISTNHSIKQRDYVDWLVTKLGTLVRRRARVTHNGGWGTLNYAVGTLYHKWIKELSKSLYINNKKTVTREYLNKLDTLGLAVWFMDDGSYAGSISTHGFSYEENIIMRDYFQEVWNIESVVRKDSRKDLYYIMIKSIKEFRDLIKEHIPPCMMYKVDRSFTPPPLDTEDHITVINEIPMQELVPAYITEIKKLKTTPRYLYQITVEKNHNFFCNNVLVKNCGYFPLSAFQEMQPSLNVWTRGYREAVAGVPTGLREGNVLYMADQENPGFTKHRVSALDNPRVTPEDIETFRVQYGGVDTDEYLHYVLGIHGKPVFALFDRNLLQIDPYPVIKLDIDGIKLADNLDEVLTKILAFPQIKTREYGVLMGIDLGYCYSADTEVLTNRGWLKHEDITIKDKIACFDTAKDRIVWDDFLYLWEQDYKGKMLEVSGKSTNFCVSPEHSVWIKRNRSKKMAKYEVLKAKQLLKLTGNRFKVKIAAESQHVAGDDTFTVPYYYSGRKDREAKNTTISMRDWVEFLGWFISEGSATASNDWLINITQQEGYYADLIDSNLSKLPYTVSRKVFVTQWGKNQVQWGINCKELCLWLRDNCGVHSENKKVPDFIFNCSTDDQELFLRTLLMGDGSRVHSNRSPQYNSQSELLVDQVQRIAISLGYSSTKGFYKASGMYRCTIMRRQENEISRDTGIKEIDYEGKIYCLKTNQGFYVTRRNGRVAIQGNTEPTAIVIMYIDSNDRIKFHGRIKLSKVSYPIQEKIIDMLDTRFSPQIIGMDEGSAGKSVRQHLIQDKEYISKQYDKRMVAIDFSSSLVIGVGPDGAEIKSKTKPFTVSILQDYSNNHKLIYSSTDMDMVSELERMTYSKSTTGDITYKTLTDRGGKRGDDHFTSALLCCIGAYHLTNGMVITKRAPLLRPSWVY